MIPQLSAIMGTIQNLDSLFGMVKEKLLNNPSEASSKLAEVLDELSQILDFVEKETVHYLEIYFLPDKSNFIECRSALLTLESGYVAIKGYEARGHCHKISNIYRKYLDHWFSQVLDPNEANDFKQLFNSLTDADSDMIYGIQEITTWLREEAEFILDMIDTDQLDQANQRIQQSRRDVQQTRRQIVEALAQLRLLQASFIASSESV